MTLFAPSRPRSALTAPSLGAPEQHPTASNGDWTGRDDPLGKRRRKNRVLAHFETCTIGKGNKALRDFAKVLKLAEGGDCA